ncbi:hypothetical protein PVL30_005315 [Lodderomyces elongisporus]|uniref:uncharacterized protein n=1 Tax=Lodderomyces elongisporus TaxID=36914 RepID=UPI002922A5EA|nr:uncharacterized protein PVL30_005315 [Lodderomyces elongisporus]WLF81518.1 hypothetical protein PVL30_005315 [Lodderomyces elongisporus]
MSDISIPIAMLWTFIPLIVLGSYLIYKRVGRTNVIDDEERGGLLNNTETRDYDEYREPRNIQTETATETSPLLQSETVSPSTLNKTQQHKFEERVREIVQDIPDENTNEVINEAPVSKKASTSKEQKEDAPETNDGIKQTLEPKQKHTSQDKNQDLVETMHENTKESNGVPIQNSDQSSKNKEQNQIKDQATKVPTPESEPKNTENTEKIDGQAQNVQTEQKDASTKSNNTTVNSASLEEDPSTPVSAPTTNSNKKKKKKNGKKSKKKGKK